MKLNWTCPQEGAPLQLSLLQLRETSDSLPKLRYSYWQKLGRDEIAFIESNATIDGMRFTLDEEFIEDESWYNYSYNIKTYEEPHH